MTPTTIPSRTHVSHAFTLIEMILAMAVGAIVILAIQTVFFGALRLRNTSEQRMDQELAIHRTLEVIKKDFSGLLLPGGVLAADFQTSTSYSLNSTVPGERISAEFFTNSGRIDAYSPFADAQRVAYYLSPHPQSGHFELVRTFNRNLLPVSEDEPGVQTLLGGIDSAFFDYFDGSSWTETWDSTVTPTLPSAVRFTMQLSPNSTLNTSTTTVEVVVPISVAVADTATSTTGTTP